MARSTPVPAWSDWLSGSLCPWPGVPIGCVLVSSPKPGTAACISLGTSSGVSASATDSRTPPAGLLQAVASEADIASSSTWLVREEALLSAYSNVEDSDTVREERLVLRCAAE
jgi:hypothetical protein